jgi:ubiquinone/menaquinone biosynthesis C-methylase UbiE
MSDPSQNKYVIDIEAAAETARLMEQDRLVTRSMGGLFPERLDDDLSDVHQILDIACGPGGWALDVAFTYPEKEVVGVDINQTMIKYAFAQARVRKLQNVTFEFMDVRQPIEFQDASFDLVNARTICAFMDKAAWPLFLAECKRILRSGGCIRLTELEAGDSNSLAGKRLQWLVNQAFMQQGRTFSVDGNSIGIIYMLGRLLRDAGFSDVQQRAFIMDGSYGSDLHYNGCKDAEVAFSLLKPYLLKTGLVDEAEYDRLYHQMLIDFMSDSYTGIYHGLTVWATK